MSHHRGPKSLIVLGLLVAGLVCVGVAEALIIYDFPIFGVVNGVQTARINAVLNNPPEPDLPCPVTLVFIDSQGNQLGGPDTFQLRGGAAVHADFVIDPNSRTGERLQIRARVTIGDPNIFPGCTAGVLASVEVIDRLTRATHTILANPVTTETRAGQ